MKNTDEIKSLERELGRWQKKARDQAAEIRALREEAARLRAGSGELRRAADALLTAAAVEYGAREPGAPPGWRLALPRFDAERTLEQYALQTRREDGVYVLRAALRK